MLEIEACSGVIPFSLREIVEINIGCWTSDILLSNIWGIPRGSTGKRIEAFEKEDQNLSVHYRDGL